MMRLSRWFLVATALAVVVFVACGSPADDVTGRDVAIVEAWVTEVFSGDYERAATFVYGEMGEPEGMDRLARMVNGYERASLWLYEASPDVSGPGSDLRNVCAVFEGEGLPLFGAIVMRTWDIGDRIWEFRPNTTACELVPPHAKVVLAGPADLDSQTELPQVELGARILTKEIPTVGSDTVHFATVYEVVGGGFCLYFAGGPADCPLRYVDGDPVTRTVTTREVPLPREVCVFGAVGAEAQNLVLIVPDGEIPIDVIDIPGSPVNTYVHCWQGDEQAHEIEVGHVGGRPTSTIVSGVPARSALECLPGEGIASESKTFSSEIPGASTPEGAAQSAVTHVSGPPTHFGPEGWEDVMFWWVQDGRTVAVGVVSPLLAGGWGLVELIFCD